MVGSAPPPVAPGTTGVGAAPVVGAGAVPVPPALVAAGVPAGTEPEGIPAVGGAVPTPGGVPEDDVDVPVVEQAEALGVPLLRAADEFPDRRLVGLAEDLGRPVDGVSRAG